MPLTALSLPGGQMWALRWRRARWMGMEAWGIGFYLRCQVLSHINLKQLLLRQASADLSGLNQLHSPQLQAGSGGHLAGQSSPGARVQGHVGQLHSWVFFSIFFTNMFQILLWNIHTIQITNMQTPISPPLLRNKMLPIALKFPVPCILRTLESWGGKGVYSISTQEGALVQEEGS